MPHLTGRPLWSDTMPAGERQSFAALARVMELARSAQVPVNGSVSCAFGCPMEGEVDADTVLDWAARLVDAGAHGISLCDTTGMAHPRQVEAMVHGWPDDVARMLDWCRQGPPGARVTSLHVNEAAGEFEGFERRPSA